MSCPKGHPYSQLTNIATSQCNDCKEVSKLVMGCLTCGIGLCGACALRLPSTSRPRAGSLTRLVSGGDQKRAPGSCPRGHSVVISTHSMAWSCDQCRRSSQADTLKSARCDLCDYDMCEDCWPSAGGGDASTSRGATTHVDPFAQAQPPAGAICARGHTLTPTQHNVTWGCDACHQTHQGGTKRSLRCNVCDYDRCEGCWSSAPIKAQNPQDSNQPPQYPFNPGQPQPQPQLRPPQQALSRDASQPMVTCPKNHKLYVQLHNLRWNCDGCHGQFDANSRRSLRCDSCDFDMCDQCWMFGVGNKPPASTPHPTTQPQPHGFPQAQPQPVPQTVAALCQKGHPLAQTRHQQQWGCDVCRTMNNANSLNSMRCSTCDFDICENCFQKQLQSIPQQQPVPQQQPIQPPSQQGPQSSSSGGYVPKCRTGHVLRQTTHRRSWRCDGCLRTLSSGWEASMHCNSCNFDLCSRCVRPPTTKPTSQPQPPATKPTTSGWPPAPSHNHTTTPSPWQTSSATVQPPSGGPSGNSVFQSGFHPTPIKAPGSMGKLKVHHPPGRCRSLFIGINYPGTKVALKGCWNDVTTMLGLLDAMKFDLTDKQILVDDTRFRGRTGHPDKQSIITALHWLVKGAQEGDSLFLHYSGHGSQLKDQDQDEDDGFDETLVPADYEHHGQIRDDDIHAIVCHNLPAGVRLTSVMDCCHSGTLMDLEYQWVDDMARATPKPKKGSKKMASWNNRGFQVASRKHCAAEVVLFSGCKDAQTSADVKNTNSFQHDLNDPGTAGGACTNAMAEIITQQLKTSTAANFNMSYVQLLREMQANLKRRKYTQVPQMSTSRPIDLEDQFSLYGPL